jgi:RHS repeat-associated protein
LVMAGISSKSFQSSSPDCGCPGNKKGFNGNEIQSKEFSDGSGLDVYDFNARTYDQQLGRFIQIDPLGEDGGQESLSPYQFSFNNPVRYNDPDGKCPFCPAIPLIVEAVKWIAVGASSYYAAKAVAPIIEKGAENAGKALSDATVGAAGTALPASSGSAAQQDFALERQLAKAQGTQNTKTNESASNQNTGGGGRGSNNRKPDPSATGDHSVINNNGNTTYKKNSKNPTTGFDEVKRTDTKGKAHTNSDGSKVPTPHVHEKGKKDVRPAVKGQDY